MSEPITTPQKTARGTFAPGNSGGPGRPPGSRHKLAEGLLSKLAADFATHGQDAIDRVRTGDPSTYLKVIASLIPKDVQLSGPDGGPVAVSLRLEVVRSDGDGRPMQQDPT